MAPPSQYEFTPSQNEVIAKAAGRTRGVGIIGYITAAFDLLGGNVLGAGIAFAIGYQFHQGGSALQRVVDSQGNDVTHLMEALDKIATAFMIKLVLVMIAGGIVILLGLLVGGALVSALSQGL